VKWAGIQNTLEEARSDVLIILDCCASGTANTDDGHGITELIAACGFNVSAYPVGAYSFTRALIIELRLLSRIPCFTVSMLYNNILSRIQKCMPERQELLKPPLYVILSQDRELPRGIQLSPRSSTHPSSSSSLQTNIPFDPTSSNSQIMGPNSDTVGQVHIPEALLSNTLSLVGFPPKSSTENLLGGHPRLDLNIWLQKSMPLVDFPVEVFGDWLRMMPILAQRVQIDTGTISIFTLLKLIQSTLIRQAPLKYCHINY
jgi:hypothetical protein